MRKTGRRKPRREGEKKKRRKGEKEKRRKEERARDPCGSTWTVIIIHLTFFRIYHAHLSNGSFNWNELLLFFVFFAPWQMSGV